MKKSTIFKSLALFLLLSGVALAATVFLTVTAGPYSEAGGSATMDGITHLYISVFPSAELPASDSTVVVYEDGKKIWKGDGLALSNKLIKSYTNDERHRYTLEVGEADGIWLTAKLLYD